MTNDDSTKAMDQAAEEAKKDYLANVRSEGTPGDVESWWKRWYLTAGHKRLGRILLECAKSL